MGKRRLQEVSQEPSRIIDAELRWIQALRYINENTLDELHKNLIQECTSVRAAASQAHMSDLKSSLQRNLSKLANSVNSMELQGRFSGASRSIGDEAQRMNRIEPSGGVDEMPVKALT